MTSAPSLVEAIAALQYAFKANGLKLPKATELASELEGMQFLTALRAEARFLQHEARSRTLGTQNEAEVMGTKVRWPERRRAFDDYRNAL